MAASGPDRCPWCDYDLEGLPPPHSCPECGTQYDQHTRIWRTAYPHLLWIPFSLALLYAFVLLVCMILVGHARGHSVLTVFILPLILCAAVAALSGWGIRHVRLKRWLAITPRGLVIHYVLGPELIPWENLTDVTPSLLERYVFIHRRSRGPWKQSVKGILSSGHEVVAFVSAVREAKARYMATEPPARTIERTS